MRPRVALLAPLAAFAAFAVSTTAVAAPPTAESVDVRFAADNAGV